MLIVMNDKAIHTIAVADVCTKFCVNLASDAENKWVLTYWHTKQTAQYDRIHPL